MHTLFPAFIRCLPQHNVHSYLCRDTLDQLLYIKFEIWVLFDFWRWTSEATVFFYSNLEYFESMKWSSIYFRSVLNPSVIKSEA